MMVLSIEEELADAADFAISRLAENPHACVNAEALLYADNVAYVVIPLPANVIEGAELSITIRKAYPP